MIGVLEVAKKKEESKQQPANEAGRVPISFKFSADGLRMADDLGELLGVSRTAVFEMAVRALYRANFKTAEKKE